jgi:hypothetical protein
MKQRYLEVMLGHLQPNPKDVSSPAMRVVIRPDPNSPARRQAFQEFFEELKAWEPEENGSAAEFYHQKCLLYGEALRWVPPSPLLNQVIRDYMNFLSSSRSQFSSFPEWYAHLKTLLSGYVMADVMGTIEAAQEALQSSDDPFFKLFLRLSKASAEK